MEKVDYCRMSSIDDKINGFSYLMALVFDDIDSEATPNTLKMSNAEAEIYSVKSCLEAILQDIKRDVIENDNWLYSLNEHNHAYKTIISKELKREYSFDDLETINRQEEERILREMEK